MVLTVLQEPATVIFTTGEEASLGQMVHVIGDGQQGLGLNRTEWKTVALRVLEGWKEGIKKIR